MADTSEVPRDLTAPAGPALEERGTDARMAWVDVAKGASIVLVVLVHVTNRHLVDLTDASELARTAWFRLGQWMRPVRMPLFFLLSGLLASSALRSHPDRVRQRIVRSFELYAVWLVLQTALVDHALRPRVEANPLGGFLHALVLPAGSLWYLWAVAAYLLVLAVLPVRWRGPVLGALAVAGVMASTRHWALDPRVRDLVQYLPWLGLGALAPQLVRGVVARVTDRRAVVAVVAFALGVNLLRSHGPDWIPVLQVLGVVAGLSVAASLRGQVADGLAALGQRTLSIYVLHVPLLTIWDHEVHQTSWRGWLPLGVAFWLYPVLLTAGLISLSFAIERTVRQLGGGRLFGDRPAGRAA